MYDRGNPPPSPPNEVDDSYAHLRNGQRTWKWVPNRARHGAIIWIREEVTPGEPDYRYIYEGKLHNTINDITGACEDLILWRRELVPPGEINPPSFTRTDGSTKKRSTWTGKGTCFGRTKWSATCPSRPPNQARIKDRSMTR